MTEDIHLQLTRVRRLLADARLTVIDGDLARPWGGFLVVSQDHVERFLEAFFPNAELTHDHNELFLSPKILLVAPHQRLSWQYHRRRAEVWTVVEGPVGVSHSLHDAERDAERVETGALLHHKLGVRHRLIGLDVWGIVAEIWQHTDPSHPSDEQDIVRVQDDHNRC